MRESAYIPGKAPVFIVYNMQLAYATLFNHLLETADMLHQSVLYIFGHVNFNIEHWEQRKNNDMFQTMCNNTSIQKVWIVG